MELERGGVECILEFSSFFSFLSSDRPTLHGRIFPTPRHRSVNFHNWTVITGVIRLYSNAVAEDPDLKNCPRIRISTYSLLKKKTRNTVSLPNEI